MFSIFAFYDHIHTFHTYFRRCCFFVASDFNVWISTMCGTNEWKNRQMLRSVKFVFEMKKKMNWKLKTSNALPIWAAINLKRKRWRRRVQKTECDLLIIHTLPGDVKIIIRKLKLTFTLFSYAICTYFVRSLLFATAECVRCVFTSNHCRLSALSSAITLYRHTNSYPSIFILIFISDAYKKNHFVRDPRCTIHDKHKGINTLFLDCFFVNGRAIAFLLCDQWNVVISETKQSPTATTTKS